MINKYYLYITVTAIVSLFLLGPRLYYMLTFERVMGRKAGVYSKLVATKTGGRSRVTYPKIRFYTEEYEITFLAPSYMAEPYAGVENIEVLYDKKHPEHAYAYNFYGFWGPVFIYYVPFFLIWTIIIFSVGFIPKYINVRAIEKRLFGK